ncbi:MAG: response regulator [Gammaproteobacteria bacterium]
MSEVRLTDYHIPRILVVDDEDAVRAELLDMFEDEGLDAVEASNAQHALDLLRDDKDIGIVFTDLRMPGMNGMELAAKIKQDYEKTRPVSVVVITGHGGMDEAVDALNIGVTDFVTKPFSFERTTQATKRAAELWHEKTKAQFVKHNLFATVDMQREEIERLCQDLIDRNIKLEAAQRSKEHFVRSMGNELRTPLNHLNGAVEVIADTIGDTDDAEMRQWVDIIADAAHQLDSHVDAILELSDVDTTGSGVRRTRFSPHDVCLQIAVLFEDKAIMRGKTLSINNRAADAKIYADRGRFLLCLGFLVDNAIRHAEGASNVEIDIAFSLENQSVVHVQVCDDGAGMTERQIKRALNPKTTIERVSDGGAGSLGLGLYLARRNAQLNGGELRISPNLPSGLRVSVELPVLNHGSQ